jgi:hypothetical protein
VVFTLTDNGNGTLNVSPNDITSNVTMTNSYEAKGSITFEGTKKLEGRQLEEDDAFTFEILENGKTVATATSDMTGKIDYPTITYVKNSKTNDTGTHTYTVKETTTDGKGITVATNTYTVTVDVADAGDGSLTVTPSSNYQSLDFINTYKATGNVTFEGTKSIEGRDLTEDDVFTFEISEGGKTVATATSNSTGKIDYPTITYVKDSKTNDTGTHT